MIQVWTYDENKVFVESIFVDEVTQNMTTIPFLVGYIKPTFNEELEEWFEGAIEEEIKEWQETNKPKPQEPNKLELLKEELILLREENKNIIKEKEALKNRLDATENAVLELMMTYKIDSTN